MTSVIEDIRFPLRQVEKSPGFGVVAVLTLALNNGANTVVLAGLVISIMGALIGWRFMTSLLFGVSATDPATDAVVSILPCIDGLAACYIPVRRTPRVGSPRGLAVRIKRCE